MIFTGKRLGSGGSVLVSLGAFGAGALPRPELVPAGPGRLLAITALYLGIAMLVCAWVRLGHSVRANGTTSREVTRTAWSWSIPLLCAPPLFSTDLYTYLAQGAVAHAGLDPYTHVPAEISSPVTESAAGGWLAIASPYGPLQILIVKSVLAVTGENVVLGVLLTRLAMTAGLALLCFAVPVLCRHLGGKPADALWLTVANPLVVLCVVSGGHNDLLMVGLLAAGTALVLTRAHVAGFAAVALAAAVKAPAAVVLPFLVWVWAAHRPGGRFAVLAASVSIVAGTFGLCGVAAGVGLGWLRNLGGNSRLEPLLSIPTTLGKIGEAVLPGSVDAVAACRPAGWVVLAALVTWLSAPARSTAA